MPKQPVVEPAAASNFLQKVRQLIRLEIGVDFLLNGCRSYELGFPAFFMSIYAALFLSGGIMSCITAHLHMSPTSTLYFRYVGKFFPELSAMYWKSSNVTSTKRLLAIGCRSRKDAR